MSTALFRVAWPLVGGDPQDVPHHDFVCVLPGTSVTIADAAVVTPLLSNFYGVAPAGGTREVGAYMSSAVQQHPFANLEVYDIGAHLDGSAHGSPVLIDTVTRAASVGDNLPMGCATVLSYASDYADATEFSAAVDTTIPTDDRAVDEGAGATHSGHDRPRARHRGRIYIGPLTVTSHFTDGTTGRVRVHATCMSDMTRAAVEFGVAVQGHAGFNWVQWSRRDNTVRRISSVWMDDRYDYQRRREDQGLTRDTRVIPI